MYKRQTYYALEDMEDDIKIGINSTAILWGNAAVKVSRVLHLCFYISLLLIAMLNSFSYFFFFIFAALLIIFIYQKILINDKKFLEAFKINNLVGILSVIGFAIEILILG